jgi:saccharopine dehydrogenase-like NADP-dependent oxidoreductase
MKNVVVYPDLKEIAKKMPGATYISYPTAVAVASFAKIMPQIKMRGVFPPEALNSKIRRDILIELEGYGIKVQQEFSRI